MIVFFTGAMTDMIAMIVEAIEATTVMTDEIITIDKMIVEVEAMVEVITALGHQF